MDIPQFLSRSGRVWEYHLEADSSQNQVRRLAEAGASEGALVVVETQTAGRGRRGRVWYSAPQASLTFSLLLRPRSAQILPLIAFAAAVALREAVGVGGLKWPNDLLAPDHRKLAGILVEAAHRREGVVAVLGVGLNLRHPVPEGAAALKDYTGLNRSEVLQSFLEHFERHYASLPEGGVEVLEAWRRYSYTLGQRVRVQLEGGYSRGLRCL